MMAPDIDIRETATERAIRTALACMARRRYIDATEILKEAVGMEEGEWDLYRFDASQTHEAIDDARLREER